MATIYNLKQHQQELLDNLFWIEEGDTEADIIKRQLEQIEGSVERKLAYLTSVLAEAIAVSRVTKEAHREVDNRLGLKAKRAERAEERLREFILSVMRDFNINKVEGDIINVSQYEREALQVPDEPNFDILPSAFKKVTEELNKKEITSWLKDGQTLSGFELIKRPCLRIS